MESGVSNQRQRPRHVSVHGMSTMFWTRDPSVWGLFRHGHEERERIVAEAGSNDARTKDAAR